MGEEFVKALEDRKDEREGKGGRDGRRRGQER